MNYKTYAKAKIANPDCEIVTTGKIWNGCDDAVGVFEKKMKEHQMGDEAWAVCNPADYCSSLKEFLDAGFKLAKGDYLINIWGNVGAAAGHDGDNAPDGDDYKRYVLSASALNGGCKIPAKAEQWTVYNNNLPLCELTDEQAGMLFNAWRGGANIQFRTMDVNVWVDKPEHDATIKKGGVYRVKHKSERELFIDAAVSCLSASGSMTVQQMAIAACQMFDSGKFKCIDNTQHFGENI